MATVGGNLCLALPAGPMTALCVALDGVCTIWQAASERMLPAVEFVLGPRHNALHAGEVLRAIDLPLASLRRQTAFRQISLSTYGRSAALLIGTRDPVSGAFALTVTGSTPHPVQLRFEATPDEDALLTRLDQAIPPEMYYDDVHGHPVWRAAMTRRFAAEIRAELG
jgi:CO/xanthine dehydrogenase FAD-binding subunit